MNLRPRLSLLSHEDVERIVAGAHDLLATTGVRVEHDDALAGLLTGILLALGAVACEDARDMNEGLGGQWRAGQQPRERVPGLLARQASVRRPTAG